MAAGTQELIERAYRRVVGEIPALERLKLTVRLQLRARGDVQVFGVASPGPRISKGEPEGARLELSLARSHFNELAADGTLKHWRDAYEHGHVKVGGDPAVVKLLGTVIAKHEARSRHKRVS